MLLGSNGFIPHLGLYVLFAALPASRGGEASISLTLWRVWWCGLWVALSSSLLYWRVGSQAGNARDPSYLVLYWSELP